MNKNQRLKTVQMTELAILTAIVLVLQLTGTAIKLTGLGTSISLVLIPIVLGAVLLGPAAGAWLGFTFGAVTYLMGVFGLDAFTNILFTYHPVLTALICFGKGICAGLAAGLIYRALLKINPYVAAIAAAAAAPIVNTGLFVLGGLTMTETLAVNFADGQGVSVIYFLIVICAGINFIFELLLNLVLSPVIYRVSVIVKKSIHRNMTNV